MKILDIRLRRSTRGVPHIVVETDEDTYSIQYFARNGHYKVWRGYSKEDIKIYSKEFAPGETVKLATIIQNPNR